MMDPTTELAKMLKERNNQHIPSITTGIVLKPPPAIKIRLNDVIVLEKDRLIFSSQVLGGYKRRIRFTDYDAGITTTENDGGQGASNHSHRIQEINVDTEMEWVDTLIEGDEVILMPTVDEQLFVVIDKAVRLE